MGILNVTPDSFSDGGEYYKHQNAVDRALRMEDAGAAIIDVGGESTRPYSDSVSAADEKERTIPVIERLAGRVSCPISIDTSKASVAQAAVNAGAQIINDVTGLEGDREMMNVAARSGVGICAMHMQGTPQTMQDDPQYDDVVEQIYDYLQLRKTALADAGIPTEKICLDPGIGFGKTHEHNLTLLRNASRFLDLDSPILVGHSRKGFIKKLVGDELLSRDAGTLGASLALAAKGIHIIRVHNVEMTCAALRLFRATQ